MYTKIFYIIVFCTLTSISYSQNNNEVPLITADSMASGNYKDVMTSFYKLAFNNLTGLNKELKFSSNPFALMLKANPDLAIDKDYLKYKALRNLNFNFDAKLDSNYHFNGFASGISYALINKRDHTVYDQFIDLVEKKNSAYHKFHEDIVKVLSDNKYTSQKKQFENETRDFFTKDGKSFSSLDSNLQKIILQVAKDDKLDTIIVHLTKNPDIKIINEVNENYQDVKKQFQNKLLWTVGVSDTTYNNQFLFSNITLSTELLKGLSDTKKISNIELDIKASLNFVDDTLSFGRNLKRSVFNFEPGLNWVLKAKSNDQSILEFKLSGSYNHIFSGLYDKEKSDISTINGTLRFRITNNFWIPLQIKYDPTNGNFLGFLNVTTNFTGLKSLISGKSS